MSTLYAYLTKYSALTGVDLHSATKEQLVSGLHFSSLDMAAEGWVKVGEAEVQVTLYSRAEVVGTAVSNLRKQITETKTQAGAQVLLLERQINSLLCIEGAASEVTA